MSSPWIVLVGIAVIGAGYVLLPVAYDAWRRFRGRRAVRCPETGAPAEVDLDARGAAVAAMFRDPTPRVERCSEWPEREGCQQGCVSPAEVERGEVAHPRVR